MSNAHFCCYDDQKKCWLLLTPTLNTSDIATQQNNNSNTSPGFSRVYLRLFILGGRDDKLFFSCFLVGIPTEGDPDSCCLQWFLVFGMGVP